MGRLERMELLVQCNQLQRWMRQPQARPVAVGVDHSVGISEPYRSVLLSDPHALPH